MVRKSTSQSQQTESPKAGPQVSANPFDKVAEDNLARVEAYLDELQKIQEKSFEQAQAAIDEGAKLMKEQIAYSAKLTGEFQRIALESSRQAAQFMTKPWVAN